MKKFVLHPFPTDRILPAIEISGQIERHEQIFSIEYRLQGDLDAVIIAPAAIEPIRKSELWLATCFEFFIGIPGHPSYWEFNLSPSGDWNVFHLDDYRQGLRDEAAFISLPVTIDRGVDSLGLRLEFNLDRIISIDNNNLEVAVTTVIKSTQNEISYWALIHTGQDADFHRRDSFLINI
jgi:hypothetical protein